MPPPPGSAQLPSPHTRPPVRAPRTVTEGVSGRRGLKRRGSSGGAGILHPARPALAPAPAVTPGSWVARASRLHCPPPLAREQRPTGTRPEGPPPRASFPVVWRVGGRFSASPPRPPTFPFSSTAEIVTIGLGSRFS